MKINQSGGLPPPEATGIRVTKTAELPPGSAQNNALVARVVSITQVTNPQTATLPALRWPAAQSAGSTATALWTLGLELSNQRGVYKSLSVYSPIPLAVGSKLAVNEQSNPTQIVVDTQASKSLLLREGLIAANQARPSSDLVALGKITQALAPQLSAIAQGLNPGLIQQLSALANWGVHSKHSQSTTSLKQLFANAGLFARSATDSPSSSDKSASSSKHLALQLLSSLATNTQPASHSSAPIPQASSSALEQLRLLVAMQSNPQLPTSNQANNSDELLSAFKHQATRLLTQVLLGMQARQISATSEFNSLTEKTSSEQLLLNIQLPIHWTESTGNFSLSVSRRLQESRQGEEPDYLWQFEIHLELPQEQTMTVRCALINDNCRLQFWANTERLKQQIDEQVTTLKTSMKNDGLAVNYCQCQVGEPPQKEPTVYKTLINTRV